MVDDAERQVRGGSGAEGLEPKEWSNGPGAWYQRHEHPYHKLVYCVRGSITFHMASGDAQLLAGQRLDIAAGTPHAATVGPEGVTCWETQRPR